MIKLAKENVKEEMMMREAVTSTVIELAKTDDRIVMLDADLVSCLGEGNFGKEYPGHLINCGIAEANMIGVAAGMSAAGMIPFCHTFGPFATRRVCDQVFISAAYAKLNVRIIGTDPGVTAEYNGGTHMPFEDVAIMRSIPDITIIDPTDTAMAKWATKVIKDIYGVVYMRLPRKNCIKVYEDGSEFELGRGVTVRNGSDVTIIASGIMVAESIEAAKLLAASGIDARVVDIFTIKPIDAELIAKCAKETGAIVTAENHNVIGGLGSAVAEVLCENAPAPLVRVGAQDKFGEVGPLDYLKKQFGLTAPDIAAAAKAAIAKK